MEFEELQQIWNSQNSKPMYALNEDALHRRIDTKKNQASHITNISELLGIIANACSGIFIVGMNLYNRSQNIFLYAMAAWMLGTSFYFLVSRIRRKKTGNQFDRSLRGDLAYAISMSTYQVRISLLMRWNILPIAILILLGMWDGGKSIMLAAVLLLFFVLVYFASGWEHNIYKSRKRELETLQSRLDSAN